MTFVKLYSSQAARDARDGGSLAANDENPLVRRRHLGQGLGQLHDEDHPGCIISGSLLVNRVPGNFHIEVL